MFFCFLLQGIFISKISENGPAGQDGILKTGDKIMKVNFLLITVWVAKLMSPVVLMKSFFRTLTARKLGREQNNWLSPSARTPSVLRSRPSFLTVITLFFRTLATLACSFCVVFALPRRGYITVFGLVWGWKTVQKSWRVLTMCLQSICLIGISDKVSDKNINSEYWKVLARITDPGNQSLMY